MRKKSSYFFSAKKLLAMYGIFAQLRKTVLVLFVNLGLSARVSQLTIQNTYYTYLYCLYVLYTIHATRPLTVYSNTLLLAERRDAQSDETAQSEKGRKHFFSPLKLIRFLF